LTIWFIIIIPHIRILSILLVLIVKLWLWWLNLSKVILRLIVINLRLHLRLLLLFEIKILNLLPKVIIDLSPSYSIIKILNHIQIISRIYSSN
jgi:hypothetical protein